MLRAIDPSELPSGATIDAVVAFALAACPSFLMAHNYRTFLFGRMLVVDDLDEEVAFVASMFHDIGLVDDHVGATSFELVGADIAARFLEAREWSTERIRLVEHAIIRHVELAPHNLPELRVVQAGAAFDVAGIPAEAVGHSTTAAILAAHPRRTMAVDIHSMILAEIGRQPNPTAS